MFLFVKHALRCKMGQDYGGGWSPSQNELLYRFCDLGPATVENVNEWRGQMIYMGVWRLMRPREGFKLCRVGKP